MARVNNMCTLLQMLTFPSSVACRCFFLVTMYGATKLHLSTFHFCTAVRVMVLPLDPDLLWAMILECFP